MKSLRLTATLLLAVACSFAVTPGPKKKSTAKKAAVNGKSASRKSSSKKTAAKTKTVASWRNTQRTPTPDRYREIQQALAAKGYLQPGAPNGVWDTSSIAALKKFQEDQNLEPSGKLDSLSLIALGLGPRRDQPPASQPPAP
jgi:peptidoglycan hydrolase-like protein with peptidoglycan-binding domain